MRALGLDIGSNSVGSAWIDHDTGKITVGISVFPAGVDESDEKRGDPKNVKRRTSRRTRITLARRAYRKRALRLRLIKEGLLPEDESKFKTLLEETDPWILRCKGLTQAVHPQQFGRVLLHLSQRRGAVGFDADVGDTGNVKKAIVDLQLTMLDRLGSNESRNDAQQLRRTIESLEKKKSRSESESQELDDAREKLQQLCRGLLKDKTVTVGRLMAMLREERLLRSQRQIGENVRRARANGKALFAIKAASSSFTPIGQCFATNSQSSGTPKSNSTVRSQNS
jgi:CRISPR/Cas system Type II protein with McrA/HNH and RuvC-like nuclease domain